MVKQVKSLEELEMYAQCLVAVWLDGLQKIIPKIAGYYLLNSNIYIC